VKQKEHFHHRKLLLDRAFDQYHGQEHHLMELLLHYTAKLREPGSRFLHSGLHIAFKGMQEMKYIRAPYDGTRELYLNARLGR